MLPETVLSPNLTYSARPTVHVDDRGFPEFDALLQAMEMTERGAGLSALELRFSNVAGDEQGSADFAFESGAVLNLGSRITVYAGDENNPQEIFNGVITALEGEFSAAEPPTLTVLAEDALQQARMTRRTAIHEDVTLADLCSNLADTLNLTPRVDGLSTAVGVQAQLNESDLAFVRRLLDRFDADLQVVGAELQAAPHGEIDRGNVTLTLGSQLRRARVIADLAHQVTEVTVAGWDAANGRRVTGRSTGANLGVGSGQEGARLLTSLLEQRHHHISHLAVTSDDEATALADTAFDQRARRFVHVEALAEGNPALRVGGVVALQGLGPRFDNQYRVTEACHRWNQADGYQTEFQAESAYWGGA